MKESDYLDGEQMSPFSNGTEAMMWEDENCRQCNRAMRFKGNPPNFQNTLKLVNMGCECKMKLAMDYGNITGTIAVWAAQLIGLKEGRLSWQCMMFSDDDNDRWKPTPRQPYSPPDNQLCFPFIIDEIGVHVQQEKLQLA